MPTYVFYDQNGKYTGHLEDRECLMVPDPGIRIRELTSNEIKLVGNHFREYNYNDEVLQKKISPVFFIVAPSNIYEIGVHNKISISVKYIPEEVDPDLEGEQIEITVNDQKAYVTYGSQVFLDPSIPGTYVIKLTDNRVIAEDMVHVVSVIQSNIN